MTLHHRWSVLTRTVQLLSGVLIGFSFLGATAQAQEKTETETSGSPDYRHAIAQAVSEFRQHNFAESRSYFARAHSIDPSARTLRGLGMAEFELHNYRECTQQLEAALQSQTRRLEGELRAETEDLLKRAQILIGRFTIKSKPNVNDLTVDGVSTVLPPDRPLLLNVGDHLLELTAVGYGTEKRLLSVRGGEEETLSITFKKSLIVSGPRQVDRPWYAHPWVWVAVGAVIVGAATTGIVLAATSEPATAQASGGSSGIVVEGP